MSNPSKRKGTAAETRVSRFLNMHGLRTERKALAGSNDEGDLRTILPNGEEVTLEVKAGKQTQNYPRSRLDEWKRQTIVEGENSGCRPALIIVRYRRSFEDNTEVWLPNSLWGGVNGWTMLYINQFADMAWTMA